MEDPTFLGPHSTLVGDKVPLGSQSHLWVSWLECKIRNNVYQTFVLPPDQFGGKAKITHFRSGHVEPTSSICVQLCGGQAAEVGPPEGERTLAGGCEEPEGRAERPPGAAAGERVRGRVQPHPSASWARPWHCGCSHTVVNLGRMLSSD